MMIFDLIQTCLTALAVGAIFGLTLILLAVITYIVAGVISGLIRIFKEVRAKQKAEKIVKAMASMYKAFESIETEKQKTDSR